MRGIQYAAAYPRHCERSEAIHSFVVPRGGLLRFARNDVWRHLRQDLRILAAHCRPRFANPCPSKREGAGNAGCALHPRSRVQKCAKKRTRAYRYSGDIPAFPAQWLYGLYRALPGDEFVLSPSLADQRLMKLGWLTSNLRQLDTSNGCQDHTVLPYASAPFVLRAIRSLTENPPCDHFARGRCRVHRILSRVRDDGQRPSEWDRMARFVQLICPTAKAEYFCSKVWTGFRTRRLICPSGSSERLAVLQLSCPGMTRGESVAYAARRKSSASARYDSASARCSRPIFSAPSRSASVRATRSTR